MKTKEKKRRNPFAKWDAENRTSNRAGPHRNRTKDCSKRTHRVAKHKKKNRETWGD